MHRRPAARQRAQPPGPNISLTTDPHVRYTKLQKQLTLWTPYIHYEGYRFLAAGALHWLFALVLDGPVAPPLFVVKSFSGYLGMADFARAGNGLCGQSGGVFSWLGSGVVARRALRRRAEGLVLSPSGAGRAWQSVVIHWGSRHGPTLSPHEVHTHGLVFWCHFSH